MIRLALETATHWLGVAVLRGEDVLAEFSERRPMSQSSSLLPAVRSVLREAGVELEQVAELAASCGPGSFTGLRVGASTARALADALGVPLAAVPTPLALALGAAPERAGAAVLAGPRDECFGQRFEVRGELPVADGDPAPLRYAELAGFASHGALWVCEPDAAAALEERGLDGALSPAVVTPAARWVGRYAARAGGARPAREFAPVYGKSPLYRKRIRSA